MPFDFYLLESDDQQTLRQKMQSKQVDDSSLPKIVVFRKIAQLVSSQPDMAVSAAYLEYLLDKNVQGMQEMVNDLQQRARQEGHAVSISPNRVDVQCILTGFGQERALKQAYADCLKGAGIEVTRATSVNDLVSSSAYMFVYQPHLLMKLF